MADRTLWNESQFQAPKAVVRASSSGKTAAAGVTIYDACGVNATAMTESTLGGVYVNTMDLFAKMAPAGLCDESGRTVISNIQRQAVKDGFVSSAADLVGYNGNGIAEATWKPFIAHHTAAGAVVICETLEGCELFDLITMNHEDAALTGANRLQRHFVAVHRAVSTGATLPQFPHTASLPTGYLCSDGCNNLMNPVINGARKRVLAGHTMVFYTIAAIRLARLCALVAIYPKPQPAPAPVVAATPKPVVATPTTVTQTITLTLTPAELQALESLLAQLPHS